MQTKITQALEEAISVMEGLSGEWQCKSIIKLCQEALEISKGIPDKSVAFVNANEDIVHEIQIAPWTDLYIIPTTEKLQSLEVLKNRAKVALGDSDVVCELAEALKPLANLDLSPGGLDKARDEQVVYARDDSKITVGDVRKARAALATVRSTTNED